MQAFIGVCGAMIGMLYFTKALARKRRLVLINMEITAFLLLCVDRLA